MSLALLLPDEEPLWLQTRLSTVTEHRPQARNMSVLLVNHTPTGEKVDRSVRLKKIWADNIIMQYIFIIYGQRTDTHALLLKGIVWSKG